MNSELVSKLESLISKMDLPFYRKTIKGGDSLRWLSRNIGIQNSTHKNFPEAMQLIKSLYK